MRLYTVFSVLKVARLVLACVAILLALAFGGRAHAQAQCWRYFTTFVPGGGFTGQFPTAQAAAQAALQTSTTSGCTSTTTLESTNFTTNPSTGQVTGSWFYNRSFSGTCSGSSTHQGPIGMNSQLGACFPPPTCSGLASDGVGDKFTSDHFPGADGYCNTVSHCKMSVTASATIDGSTVYSVEHTNQSCAHGGVPPPGAGDASSGESCATGSGGTFCLQPQGENCGYLNDSFVCLPKVEHDGCAVFGDGSRVCGSSAPVPPRPDSGTPSVPAAPDEQITINTTNTTLNFFNASTVANSSRDPGTSGDNPHDGRDDGSGTGGGDGDCTGDECDTGSVSGGEGCDAPPECSGDVIQCAVLDQEWRTRCQAVPTVEDMLGEGEHPDELPSEELDISEAIVPDAFLGGPSCPQDVEISLGAWGSATIPFSEYCSLFNVIGIFVLAWAWLSAARIVVGAPAVAGS